MDNNGVLLIAAASLHVDMAEDEGDQSLTAFVLDVVTAAHAADIASSPSPEILQAMNEMALRTGRYYSALVARRGVDRIDVARCGLAYLFHREGSQIETLLEAELLQGIPYKVLRNGLGISRFTKPKGRTVAANEGEYLAIVGGTLACDRLQMLDNFPNASTVPRQRGGVAMVIS
ncbi:hypothetical protein [Saccharopolyspora shandongensis]|uniref:hypothetical protein n=1 Tax=Saccharopolyspora shandongensis TaxID=418495 RepID=UPI00340A5EE6